MNCRRALGVAVLCGVSGFFSLSPPAEAQYRSPDPVTEPTPEPSQPPGPTPEAYNPPLAQPQPSAGWDGVLVLEGVWEENIGFTSPSGPNDFSGVVRGSLARWRRRSRGELRLAADGAGYFYRELGTRNRADGAASLEGSLRLSRRVMGNLSASYSYGHTDTDGLIISEGLLLPPVRTQSGRAFAGLSWRLAERTTLSVDGSWMRIWFDSDELLQTETLRAEAALSRRFGPRDEFSLRATFERAADELTVRRDPSLTLGYRRRLGRSLTLGLDAGSTKSEMLATDGSDPSVSRWYFAGGASLRGRFRQGAVNLRYRHGLRPAYGLGVTELTDLVNLGLELAIGRHLDLVADGALAFRGDQGGARSQTADVFAGMALRLARRLRFVAGYRFRVRDVAADMVRNDRVSASFVFGPAAPPSAGR